MLLKILNLLLIYLTLEICGQDCSDPVSGQIDPGFWIGSPVKQITGCEKSYFKIDILKDQTSEIVQILGNQDAHILIFL